MAPRAITVVAILIQPLPPTPRFFGGSGAGGRVGFLRLDWFLLTMRSV
jgi:hypothetical protein